MLKVAQIHPGTGEVPHHISHGIGSKNKNAKTNSSLGKSISHLLSFDMHTMNSRKSLWVLFYLILSVSIILFGLTLYLLRNLQLAKNFEEHRSRFDMIIYFGLVATVPLVIDLLCENILQNNGKQHYLRLIFVIVVAIPNLLIYFGFIPLSVISFLLFLQHGNVNCMLTFKVHRLSCCEDQSCSFRSLALAKFTILHILSSSAGFIYNLSLHDVIPYHHIWKGLFAGLLILTYTYMAIATYRVVMDSNYLAGVTYLNSILAQYIFYIILLGFSAFVPVAFLATYNEDSKVILTTKLADNAYLETYFVVTGILLMTARSFEDRENIKSLKASYNLFPASMFSKFSIIVTFHPFCYRIS